MDIRYSVYILFATAVVSWLFLKFREEKRKIRTVYSVIAGGVFLSVLAIMLQVYNIPEMYGKNNNVFIAVIYSIQVMLAGYNFSDIREIIGTVQKVSDNIPVAGAGGEQIYGYISFLFMLAPISTFGFILSLFESIHAGLIYILQFWCKAYVLSELNDKTVALAKSIRKKNPFGLIIFAGMTKEKKETELMSEAEKITHVFFKREIKQMGLKFHAKTEISFFVLGDDEAENLENAMAVIAKHSQLENVELYILSTSEEGGLITDSATNEKMRVRRVDVNKQLAYSEITKSTDENGRENSITYGAKEKGGKKLISVLVVGMGGYGREIIKAVLWCGQLPGYELEINVVDANPMAESEFKAMYPEIMELNENNKPGEACYKIEFFSGIDVNTYEFNKILPRLGNTTLAFISMGNDEKNSEFAVRLRSLLRREGAMPVIKAIVYSDVRHRVLKDHKLKNFRKEDFDIDFIGNINECFSYDLITGKENEKRAEEYHISYAKAYYENSGNKDKTWEKVKEEEENKFNDYEYFRNSSMASVVYESYSEKKEYSEEELRLLCEYEHMRWNAYMRGIGYVYAPKKDDLAKQHCDLKNYRELKGTDINKDMKIVATMLSRENKRKN